MMIYVYILILTALTILTYILCNYDYFSPAFLFIALFLVSALCAMTMRDKWGYVIEPETILLILSGIIAFLVGYFIFYIKKGYVNNAHKHNIEYIHIEKWKVMFIYLFSGVSIILFLFFLFIIMVSVVDGQR